MQPRPVGRPLLWLGTVVGVVYVVAGVVGGLWPSHWDEASATDQVIWTVLLVGGGVLVAGAIAVFWTIVFFVLAVVLIVLGVREARARA